jgi:hypothetical protein
MTVEALILLKPVPGKTSEVVSRIALGKTPTSRDSEYHDEAIKRVYLATGEYGIIVYVSTEEDWGKVFRLANDFAKSNGSAKKRNLTSKAGGGSSSSSGSSGSSGSDVSRTKVIILCPKPANDP